MDDFWGEYYSRWDWVSVIDVMKEGDECVYVWMKYLEYVDGGGWKYCIWMNEEVYDCGGGKGDFRIYRVVGWVFLSWVFVGWRMKNIVMCMLGIVDSCVK